MTMARNRFSQRGAGKAGEIAVEVGGIAVGVGEIVELEACSVVDCIDIPE